MPVAGPDAASGGACRVRGARARVTRVQSTPPPSLAAPRSRAVAACRASPDLMAGRVRRASQGGTTLGNQLQENTVTVAVHFVPGMRFLVFDFGV
eukprot:1666409-Rhodomonas_salina.2